MKSTLIILLSLIVGAFAGAGQTADSFRMPDFEQVQLDNGLTLYLMEQHEVPLVSVAAFVRAGAVLDGEQMGLASMTGDGLLFGTDKLPKKAVEDTFEFVGANLATSVASDYSVLSMSSAKKDLNVLLPIFADLLTRPTFAADEFDKHQTRTLAQLQQRRESPRSVINDYFDRAMFGADGYGNPVSGTQKTVGALTPDELAGFHKDWYQPDNVALVVVGDFATRDMIARLKKQFGGWQGQSKSRPDSDNALRTLDGNQVVLVNKSDARESTFMIGGPGITRSNPDYVPLIVINTVLGGRFTSWLNDELRVNSGLTYGARSRFNALEEAGTFAISTFTKTESTEAAMDLALETYQRLWSQGIDKAALDSAKNYVKGQFPPDYETNSQLAGLLGQMFIFGFGPAFINDFEQQVDSLTTDKARQLIEKHFPRDDLQFVVIGKADAIAELMKKYGTVSRYEIEADQYGD